MTKPLNGSAKWIAVVVPTMVAFAGMVAWAANTSSRLTALEPLAGQVHNIEILVIELAVKGGLDVKELLKKP